MDNCRFCGQPASSYIYLSDGCLCYPEDKYQYLCLQHLDRCTPLGTVELLWQI